jgi:iron(III) transport system substrate-binding protein
MPNTDSWLPRCLIATLLLALSACAPPAGAPAPPASGAAPSAPVAPAPAAGPAPAAPVQAIVEAARAEGSLSLIWGETSLGGAEGVRRLTEAMNQLYGLRIEVRFTPGPAMSAMATRIMQEVQAERTASTDLVVGYADHMVPLIHAGAVEVVDWASWAPNVRDPRLVAGGGAVVAVQSGVQGITYNPERVRADEVPRTMQDLLKPQYKGRIAGQANGAGFDRLATPEMWGEQRTLDYVTRFVDQIAGLIRCTEQERLITGEFDLFALDCSHANAFRLKARGAPIDYVVPTDAAIVAPQYLAIPKTAAHPNAARLWVNYLLSREGQDLLYEYRHEDMHLIPGSKTAALVQDLEAGGHLKLTDVDFYERNDPREQTRVLNAVQQRLRTQ